eukprot:TRINITY_DN41232_c0_g1_i1.p1 TRINITY_DN41232_c0_g1~~TRINITY_DN41232_c0_g1_i1.p1  ORF type:complete len:175 (+),score=46.36 TRINITY_DN41232_c0_g1_i1:31-525(+)
MTFRSVAIVALATAISAAEAGGLQKSTPAYAMLVCDACKTVIGRLAKDVKFLTETRKMWPDSVMNERLLLACEDPTHPTGAGVEACNLFIEDHAKLVKQEVAKRWDEDSEEFEEDLVPAEFCREKAHICKEGMKGISQMMTESDIKQKALDEEKKEKEERAKKR